MTDKRTFKKLPEVFQTNTLDKFFKSTIDQWFTDEKILKISGYIGRKDPISYNPKKDFYLPEVDNTRQNYQLEPVLVTKDIDSAVINTSLFYDDTIKTLSVEGSNVDNHHRLFKSKAYSWAPPIDIDKFVNYENYYWYEPTELIRFDVMQGSTTLNITTDIIGKKSFTSYNGVQFTNGLKIRFTGNNIAPTGYLNKDYIVEGVGNSIRILDVTLPVLDNTRAYTTTDVTDRLDYITIKRGSVDENPWSRTNGWYHKDVLLRGTGTSTGTTYTDIIDNPFDKVGDDWDEVAWDATVTQKATEFALDAKRQAVRPIIEFDNNLILHDYGIESAGLVTFASTQTYDMLHNASNVTIDGIDIATDDTLIFLNVSNLLNFIKWDGEKLVNVTTGETEGIWDSISWDIEATSGVNNLGKIYRATVAAGICTLVEIRNILTEQKILITKGDERKGLEYHWDGSDWDLSQSKTKTNDEPLFQLWDLNKVKLDDIGTYPSSSFAGNKIFSYNESATGTVDTVLGKILTYKEFGQTADIVFENNLENTITWGTSSVYKIVGYRYYNQYNLNREIGDVTFIETVDLVEDTLSYNNIHGKLLSQISEFDDISSYDGKKIILFNNTENYTSAYWDIEEWDDDTPAESWAQQTDLPLLSGQTGIYTITIDSSEGIDRVLLNLTTTINHGDYVTISDGILFSRKEMTWQTGSWTEIKFKIPPATRIQNSYGNSWNPTNAFNKQRVVEKYKSDVDGTQEYILQTTPVTNSPADVVVTVDGKVAKQSTTSTAYDYNIDGNKLTFTTNKILSKDQLVEVKSFTKDAVNLNDIHYFEIPDSLEANPDNNDIFAASGAELQDHFVSILDNQSDFSGSSLGVNNYRDTASDRSKGLKILQHESSMLPLMSVIVNNNTFQVLDAIRFNQRQYVNFKNKFLQTAEFLLTKHLTTPIDVFVDTVLKDMYSKRSNLKNFQDTKAFAFGDNFIKTDVTVEFNADHIDLTELIATSGIDDRSRIIYIYRKQVTETEYELLQQITDYTFATTIDTVGNTVTRIVFPDEVKKNDKIQIRIFENIQNSFVPPTPSMMGMYQVYRPHIESDGTYIGSSKNFIVGHDGSRTLVYDDYRDQILLELEQRIYNAIPSKFVSVDYLPEINDYEYSPGKFRENDYSLTEFNRILEPIYQRWSVENKVDTFTHRDFDNSLPFTWNYAKEPDKDGKIVPGSWRGIYLYYYDTHRPHTHPWEMLGFTIKPTWWNAQYGATTENNTALWSDLEAGIIRAGTRENYTDNSYLTNNPFKRTGLSNFIPVNNSSELKDPVQAGIFGDPTVQITASGYTVPYGPDRHLPWVSGDIGPAAFSLRLNSVWPFIVNKLAFLTRPAEWTTKNWDTLNLSRAPAQKAQVIFNDTNKRKKLSELRFHQLKLTDTSTTTEYVFGYQQWIYNLLINQGIDFETAFANNIKTASVNLGYKVGGFVNNNTITIQADSYSTTRDSDNIFIPTEDKTVRLYNSASEGIRSYSGVIVEITSTGYKVYGYDPYNPVFRIIPSVTTGSKKTIDIEEVRVFEYTTHYDIVAEVEYGFEYQSVQEVFDFLISYQRYLTAVGFKFDEFDNDAKSMLDWKHSGKEFIFWAQLATWDHGSFIALSPAANKIKLDSSTLGNIASINEIINGTYAVLDKNGGAIDISNLEITRGNDEFTVNTVSGIGIYGLKINTFKSEHAIFFENKTGFNDLIYDPLFRLRQNRLKINLTKTADWDGTVEAGGYIVNNSTIVPNFNTTANDYRKFFNNRDVPTSKAQRELARHLIGYQHRDYLTNLTGDEDTSYEFYKGMIRQKGSKESIKRLLRSDAVTNEETLTLYEEFALKLGDFGATRITTDNEILIRANDVKVQNPLIEFTYEPTSVDSLTDDVIQLNHTNDGRWLRKPKTPVNEVWPKAAIGYKEISALPTAGFVHSDDITYRAYDVTALAALNTTTAATTEPLLNSIAHVAKGFNNEFSTHKLVDSGLKPEIIEAVDGSTTTSIVNITGQENPSVTGTLAIPATNIGDTIEITFDDIPATKTTVTVSTAEPASVDDPNAIPLLNLELKTDVTSIAINDSIYINTTTSGAGTLVIFDTAPIWKPVVVIGLQELPKIVRGAPKVDITGGNGSGALIKVTVARDNKVISAMSIVEAGDNYTAESTVTVEASPTSVGATPDLTQATATSKYNATLTFGTVHNSLGFTQKVTVAAGEELEQAGTNATGRVISNTSNGTTVDLTDITGTFDTTNAITASASGILGDITLQLNNQVTVDVDDTVTSNGGGSGTVRFQKIDKTEITLYNVTSGFITGDSLTAPTTASTAVLLPLANEIGNDEIVSIYPGGQISINGTIVTFTTTTAGQATYGIAVGIADDIVADINAAAPTNITAWRSGTNVILTESAGNAITIINVCNDGDGNGTAVAGANSCTGWELSTNPISADVQTVYHATKIQLDSATAGHATMDTFSALVDALRTAGTYTGVTGTSGAIQTLDTFSAADALRTADTYNGVTGTSSGSGTVGTFDIVVDGTGAVTDVTVATGGTGHAVNDTITIADAVLGGGGAAAFTMDVATSGTGTVGTFNIIVDDAGAVCSVVVVTGGTGHAVNDTITIADSSLGSGGAAAFTMDVATIAMDFDVDERVTEYDASNNEIATGVVTHVETSLIYVINVDGDGTFTAVTTDYLKGEKGNTTNKYIDTFLPVTNFTTMRSINGGGISSVNITNAGSGYNEGTLVINDTTLIFYNNDTLTSGTGDGLGNSTILEKLNSVPNVTATIQDNKIKLSTPNQTLVIADQNTGIGRELGFEEGTYHTDILLDQILAAILAANVPNLNVTKLNDIILKLTSNTSVLSVSHGVGPALDRLLFTDKNGFEVHKVDTSKVTVDTLITDINTGVTNEDFLASKTAAGMLKLEYNGTSMKVGGTGIAGLGIAAQTQSVASSSITKHDFQSGDVIVLKDVKNLDGSDAEIDGGYVVTDLSQTHSYNVKITATGMTITNKVTNGISAVAHANSIDLYDIVSADRDYIKDITLDIVQAITPIEIKLGDTVIDNSILTSFVGFVGKYYGNEKLFSAPAGNITLKTVSNNNFTTGEFNLSFTIIKRGKFTIPISVDEECQSASNIKWWRKRNFRTKTDVFNDVQSNRSYYELNDLVWVDNNPNGWLTSQHLDTNTHFGIDTLTMDSAGTGYTQGDIGVTLSFDTDTTNTKTAPAFTIDSIWYAVSKIDVTNKGIGYTSPPTVTVSGGTPDTTAAGLAVLSSTVTGITISDNGSGYKEVPVITIASNQIYSGSTWNIKHNLGQKYLNVEISDLNNTAYITKYHSPTITFVDTNNLTVVWDSITIGNIDIIKSEAVSSLQSSANTWTFAHNLNTDIPNIDIIYDDDTVATGKYDHPLIEYTDANNVKVIFPTGVSKSGYVVATYSNGNATPSNGHTHTQSVASTTWTITHNLSKQICNIDIAVLGSNIVSSDYSETIDNAKYYNIKSNYNYPIITYINANTLTATFSVATAGKLSVSCGDGSIDIDAIGSAHMTVDTDAVGCRGFNVNNGGTGYTQGDTIVVAGGTETIKASATVSSIGGGGAVTALTLINGGDYTALPATPSNGIATTGGTGNDDLTVDLNFKVASISLIESGNFQITPEILIAAPTQSAAGGCTPSQAIATATFSGIVDQVQILSGGVNYTTLPTISFSGGGGAGAAATATLDGPIEAISISNIGDLIYNPTTTNVTATGITDGTGLTVSATYKDITNFDTWFKTYRAEENPINSKLFNVAKLYDKTEHTVDATMQLIDPPKGIISGLADTEIQYKLERDPARYTDSGDVSFVHDTDETWGAKQIGQIWWDISTVRFINAELGDNRYRRKTWGELFPGSTIDIYEWVSSTVLPTLYTGTGTLFDSSRYCEIEVWNDNLNMFITTYFFWVKDVEVVPAIDFRSRSAVDVKNYITNPTKQGINWYAPISHNYEWTEQIIIGNTSTTQTIGLTVLITEISWITINGVNVNWLQGTADIDGKANTIILTSAPTINDALRIGYKRDGGAMIINNIGHLLTIDDSVLQLRYNTKPTESNVHKQWKLISPNDPRSSIPPQFINKFIDSITGYDATGLVVPDSTILNDIEKYGTLTRPRQTWFKDLKTARKEFVTFMNIKLKPLALDDERIAWDTGLTQTLITTEDWYAVKESTTSDEGITTYVYWDKDTAIINYTVKTVTERNALTTMAINDIVKVANAGNNRWKLYQFVGWGLLKSWVIISSEKAGRLFQETTYTNDLTLAQTTELRQIINALFNNVFIQDWFVYKNDIIFNMINYILTEQSEVDWIFKSTYATTTVTESDIAQKNKWKVDLLPSTELYLNEVKPYSTKFREVTGIKNIKLDTAKTHSTDFDNPPYKDTLGIFGTVNAVIPLQTSNPDHLPALQSGIYSDYFANKTDTTKVRGMTVKMYFDRIHPTIEQAKTYISGTSTIAGVDSRPVRRTTIKNKEEREMALLIEIIDATSVGESSATQIGGHLHRILKYSPSRGKIGTIVKSIVNATLAVDTDIATHAIIIQNGLQTYTGITYNNLTSTTDTTDSYYNGACLTIQEAVERYDYDQNSVLRAGQFTGPAGGDPAPGPESETQKKIKLFTNRIENAVRLIKEKLYDEEGIFNDPKKLQIEDSNRFEVANAGEDTWGWDSDEWDRHEYSATEGAEVPVRKWDDGGDLGNNYSEFKNYSLEKDTTGDKVPWHVHIPAIAGGIESVKYSTKYIYVQASGLPDHEYGPFPNANNPNNVKNQNAFWKIPLETVIPIATEKEAAPKGPIAIARNGVVIYNPESFSSYLSENIWHENAVTTETGIDNSNGHTNEANQYHYHQNPIAIYDDESYAHSPLLGYAFDGIPIYGPRSFANVNGTGEIRRMRSSYRLKSGARTAIGSESIPLGNYDGKYIEDYEYVTNLGDLDEFNGRSASTPEYPEGIYAYYITVDDLGASVYPYVIGPKYYAKPLAENFDNTEKPTITESIAQKDIYLPNYSTDRDNRDSKNFIRPQHEQYPEEFVPVNPKEGLQITTETRSVSVQFVGTFTRLASGYAIVSSGGVIGITITDPGAGYTSVNVLIRGAYVSSSSPAPSGCTATATIGTGDDAGKITSATVTAPGADYLDLALSWRQYFDADGEKRIYALGDAQSTTIVGALTKGTTEIAVTDVSKLPMPVKDTYYKGHAVPGVIFIGVERIEYYEVDHSNNKLLNCRRGTVTTTDENHTSGTTVYGITDNNTMAGNYETMWAPHSVYGSINSGSFEARFLRDNKGTALT